MVWGETWPSLSQRTLQTHKSLSPRRSWQVHLCHSRSTIKCGGRGEGAGEGVRLREGFMKHLVF